MRVASADEQKNVAQHGLGRMAAAQALDLMGDAIGAGVAQVVIADVDFAQLKATYEARRERPFLSLVGRDVKPTARPRAAEKADLVAKFKAARPQARRDVVVDFVRGQAGRVLGADGGAVLDVNQGLFEMGMDSLMSVELKSRLEAAVGRSLPSTLTFNHPSVAALSDYLIREVLDKAAAKEPAAGAVAAKPTAVEPARDRAEMNEDELAALLASKLQRPAAGKRK
jgi:acyl carrier protein